MNKEIFEDNWKQIRSQTTIWWSRMSEYDLKKVDKSAYKLEKFVTMLQVKYGYTRKQAKHEITSRVAEFEATQTKTSGETENK